MNELTFKSQKIIPVIVNDLPFLGVSQIATALHYTQSQRVVELYNRHADEFTPDMSFLTAIETNGGKQQIRVFSLRGCHLLAMFSKTPVAKEFRRWVLDLIEQQNSTILKMEKNTIDMKAIGGMVKKCVTARIKDVIQETVREELERIFNPDPMINKNVLEFYRLFQRMLKMNVDDIFCTAEVKDLENRKLKKALKKANARFSRIIKEAEIIEA